MSLHSDWFSQVIGRDGWFGVGEWFDDREEWFDAPLMRVLASPSGPPTTPKGCPCCPNGSSSSGSSLSSSGGPILEACVCPEDCTPAIRYLTLFNVGGVCSGTWPLTCSMVDIPGIGTIPVWEHYDLVDQEWGEDIFLGYAAPCNIGLDWIFQFYCVNGFYVLNYKPPAEGAQSFAAIEQRCNPFYAKFDFSRGTGFAGLISCCNYTLDQNGGNYGIVTD